MTAATAATALSRRTLLRGVGAGAAVLGLGGAACSSDTAPPARRLRIATGNPGGVYVAYGEGIAAAVRERLPHLRPEVTTTEASVQNLRLLASGDVDVAFALADAAAEAIAEPHAPGLAALARLYDNYVQVVVPAAAPVTTVADLRGRRVSTGSPASGTALVAARVLAAAGLRPTDVDAVSLDLATSADELARGRIDALFWSGGLPAAAVSGLVERTAVRLLDLADLAAALSAAHADVYVEATVPASVYGLGEPITTVTASNQLVVRAGEDDTLAHDLTRLLFDARDRIRDAHPEARRLNLRSAISTYPLELHPGAARFYREAKD